VFCPVLFNALEYERAVIQCLLTLSHGDRARSSSLFSGISPGTSRKVSLEEDSRRMVVEEGIGAREDGIHDSSAAT
jgi:hypothetical protein